MKISGHREYILHVDELEFEHYSQKKLRQQQRAHRKSHNMRMQLEITSQKRGNYFWKKYFWEIKINESFGVKNSYVFFGQILMSRIDDVKNYVAKLYLGKN